MAHLITGYAGQEHITSADQGSFNAAFFGESQFVMEIGNQFEATIVDNSTVRVKDGDLLMYGRHIRIEPNTYEDMTIETGTAGKNRIDLIVMQYEKDANDGTEKAFLQVIKGSETEGTAVDPTYTDGNILEGETMNQMPLFRVKIQGVVLSSVEALFETSPTYKALAERYEEEFVEACETYLDSLNILDSMAEIEENTQSNQLAGALALKAFAANKVDKVSGKGLSTNDFTTTLKNKYDGYSSTIANKVDKVSGKGLSTNDFTTALKNKYDGYSSTIANKVDKVSGKGLSTNDYTTTEKNNLASIISKFIMSDYFSNFKLTNDYVTGRYFSITIDVSKDGMSAGGLLSNVQKIGVNFTNTGISLEKLTTSGTWQTVWTK